MVNKFLFNLVIEYGARVGKSVFNAYQRVVQSNKNLLLIIINMYRSQQSVWQGCIIHDGQIY